MTQERDHVEKDERLAAIYREFADERVPEALNERILKMATDAQSVDRPYTRWSGWLKPLTFAATVGLSLAIVLEISQTGVERIDEATPMSVPAMTTEKDVGLREHVESDDHDETNPTMPQSSAKTTAREDFAPAASQRSVEESVRGDFIPTDRSTLDAVTEQARNREGPNQDARIYANFLGVEREATRGEQDHAPQADESAPAAIEQMESVAASPRSSIDTTYEHKELRTGDSPCREDRASADSWWTCIQSLRDTGDLKQADLEYQQFKQQYPDFLPEK